MDQFLLGLGVNFTSSLVYDVVKDYFLQTKNPTKDSLSKKLTAKLNIQGASITANKIIEFLAENGDIRILGTKMYASESITMASSDGTELVFGDNSLSKTNSSAIVADRDAFIVCSGGAKIEQDKDGSISFFV